MFNWFKKLKIDKRWKTELAPYVEYKSNNPDCRHWNNWNNDHLRCVFCGETIEMHWDSIPYYPVRSLESTFKLNCILSLVALIGRYKIDQIIDECPTVEMEMAFLDELHEIYQGKRFWDKNITDQVIKWHESD